jgi:hypothetical protein
MSFMGSSLVAPRRLADAVDRWFGQVGNQKLGSIGVAGYGEPAHEYAGYRGPKRRPANGFQSSSGRFGRLFVSRCTTNLGEFRLPGKPERLGHAWRTAEADRAKVSRAARLMASTLETFPSLAHACWSSPTTIAPMAMSLRRNLEPRCSPFGASQCQNF